jgi:hypothetical protein
MKRICKFFGVSIPVSESSHQELPLLFTEGKQPSETLLPILIFSDSVSDMTKFRRLRHVIAHGYSERFDDIPLKAALGAVPALYRTFRTHLLQWLERYENL